MKDNEQLLEAYAAVMNTPAGKLILEDLLSRLSVTVPVYAFGSNNNLSDIAFRDGQRNAGIYVYNNMALANPSITAQLYANVMEVENAKLNETTNTDG